jgi:hypothetical protein
MIPSILARVRIPVPAEVAGPLAVIGGAILLLFALWAISLRLNRGQGR